MEVRVEYRDIVCGCKGKYGEGVVWIGRDELQRERSLRMME